MQFHICEQVKLDCNYIYMNKSDIDKIILFFRTFALYICIYVRMYVTIMRLTSINYQA